MLGLWGVCGWMVVGSWVVLVCVVCVFVVVGAVFVVVVFALVVVCCCVGVVAVASLDAVRADSFTTAVQTEVPLLPVLANAAGAAAVRNFAPLFADAAVDSVLAYPRPAAIHALRALAAVRADRRAAAFAA